MHIPVWAADSTVFLPDDGGGTLVTLARRVDIWSRPSGYSHRNISDTPRCHTRRTLRRFLSPILVLLMLLTALPGAIAAQLPDESGSGWRIAGEAQACGRCPVRDLVPGRAVARRGGARQHLLRLGHRDADPSV